MKTKIPEKDAVDECCDIAESIIDEINLLSAGDRKRKSPTYEVRRKGSLKRRIMRQIKNARQIATS